MYSFGGGERGTVKAGEVTSTFDSNPYELTIGGWP